MGSEQAQQYPYDWDGQTDLPVGELLRRARHHYNLSLTDVERALRIRACQLAALEDGKIELLPGRVYAIGFVRAYAEFLGLDGGRMVHLFKTQSGAKANKPELQFPVPASESKVPNIYILSSSVAALVIVMAAFLIFGGDDNKLSSDIPSIHQQTAQNDIGGVYADMPLQAAALAAIETAAGQADAQIDIVAQKPESRIVIKAEGSSWVEIRNADGKALISRILKPGDSYLVPNEEGLKLDTGNIGVLDFSVDGTAIPKLGEKGDVRRKVALDPENLKNSAIPATTVSEETGL